MTNNLSNASESTQPAPRVRLGAISFVNTVPIYSSFEPGPSVDLLYEVPAKLNAMMRAGELDISPVSSACYLKNKDTLVLLDDLSVSSPGAVESVLFLSRTPMGPELMDGGVISVPNDSETSIQLLGYLLEEACGQDLSPWFEIYEAADYLETLKRNGNALIIGDNALMMKERLSQQEEPFYCYDLSTLWKEKTGLPFVFAVWVANRQWAKENPDSLSDVNMALCAARDRFFEESGQFEAGMQKAQERSQLPSVTLERYYRQCLTYGLSPAHHQALERFEAIIQARQAAAINRESSDVERQPTV